MLQGRPSFRCAQRVPPVTLQGKHPVLRQSNAAEGHYLIFGYETASVPSSCD